MWEKVRSCFLSGARSLLHSSPSPLSFVTPADAQPVHLSSPPLAVSGATRASDKYLRPFKAEMKEGWTGLSLSSVMLSRRERCSRAEHADSMAPRRGASVAGLRPAGKMSFSNEGGMANFSPRHCRQHSCIKPHAPRISPANKYLSLWLVPVPSTALVLPHYDTLHTEVKYLPTYTHTTLPSVIYIYILLLVFINI